MKRLAPKRDPIDFDEYLVKKNLTRKEVIEWRAIPRGIWVNLPPKSELPRLSKELGRGVEDVIYAPTRVQRLFHGSTVPNSILEGPRGTGKAVALDTLVCTLDGSPRTMADVKVGDWALSADGSPTKVIWKSDPHEDPNGTWRLWFDGQESIVCGGSHEWVTMNDFDLIPRVRSTVEILRTFGLGHLIIRGGEAARDWRITKAEELPSQSLQCIQVDHPTHLYLVGKSGIPTHNSEAIRFDAHMRAISTEGFTYLVLRREMRDLRMSHLKFMDFEMRWLNPDHKNPFNKTDNIAYYPNGSMGFYSYCVHLADVMHLLSSQFGAIYFDEITTFPWEMITKISASSRVEEGSGILAMVKGGTNPLGVGAHDVKIHFITKKVPNDPDYNPDEWEAIRTTRSDNPYVDWSQYDKRLGSLQDRTKRAWRDGEWVNEGAYFTEFAPTMGGRPWHVIEEMPSFQGQRSILDQPWIRLYRSLDWGFRPDPAVCIWYAVFPNGLAIAFKEKHWLETIAEEVAKDIVKESAGMRVIDTFADPSIFAKRGESLFSIGDIIENNGVSLTPSVNDRTRFGLAICNYLNSTVKDEVDDGEGGRMFVEYPKLQILKSGCPELIRTFPDIQADPAMPSRMADGGEDHWVVSLAYFCMGDAPPPRDPARPVTPRWMLSKRAFNRSMSVGI